MLERFEKFSLSIFSIFHYWNDIASEEMKKFGLKGICGLYLIILDTSNQGMTAADLAKACGRDKAEVSRSMNIFKENGWLNKMSENRYRALLSLSDKGREVARKLEQRAELALKMANQGIGDDKLQVFREVLSAVSTKLDIIAKNGLPAE